MQDSGTSIAKARAVEKVSGGASCVLGDMAAALAAGYAALDGRIDEDMHLVAFISASDGEGRVSVSDRPMSGYKEIITDLSVIRANEEATYAELALITGRKHQIRAQAAHIGHPARSGRCCMLTGWSCRRIFLTV